VKSVVWWDEKQVELLAVKMVVEMVEKMVWK
jgi:hypothetical protein